MSLRLSFVIIREVIVSTLLILINPSRHNTFILDAKYRFNFGISTKSNFFVAFLPRKSWISCIFYDFGCMFFSPSRRTASSLVTDGESKHDGLRVSINQTERTPLMRRMRVLDNFCDFGVNLTLRVGNPLYYGNFASEIGSFNLT